MEVHETAFVTCAFRNMHKDLSGDSYAGLWVNKSIGELSQNYLESVTPEESVAHCLRNRFFLDHLKALVKERKIEYLINFGCGFSMYPFLLPDTLKHIEIDFPHLINFKEDHLKQWQKDQKIPDREITFIGCDFNTDFTADLKAKIMEIKGTAPCFILLEGVLFFLTADQTDMLFDLFGELQKESDLVGTVSFRHEDTLNTAFERLRIFMKKLSGSGEDQVHYQTIEDRYYRNRHDYQMVRQQDFFTMSAHLGYTPQCDPDMILNEQYYLLERNGD